MFLAAVPPTSTIVTVLSFTTTRMMIPIHFGAGLIITTIQTIREKQFLTSFQLCVLLSLLSRRVRRGCCLISVREILVESGKIVIH
jgi:hypothetical protein